MSEASPPPSNMRESAIAVAGTAIKRIDGNMIAVLLLVMTMNGLFFWIYAELAKMRHVEFIAALNSCPASPGVGPGGTQLSRFPGGMDR